MRVKETRRKHLKKTPWYTGVNPLRSRPGWYESPVGMIYWDGDIFIRSNRDGGCIFTSAPLTCLWRGVSR